MSEQKIREAIVALSDLIGLMPSIDRGAICHLYTAIEALEKQLPKVPVDKVLCEDYWVGSAFGDVYQGKCPNCHKDTSSLMSICKCGQKLDWSEDVSSEEKTTREEVKE